VFRFDFFQNVYQKNIYNVMDFLSQLGGLFNSLYAGGKLAVYLVMESLIIQKVIKGLFKYSPDQEED